MIYTEERGLLYAEACFETFRIIAGAIFNWKGHADRLRLGLSLFELDLPEELEARCLAAANKVATDTLVRVTVTGGGAPRGLLPTCKRNPSVYIQCWPYVSVTEKMHLRTVTWPQPLMPRLAKFTADYAQTIRGLLVLRSKNLLADDEEALICDADILYSAPTSNLLLLVDGTWLTPDADGVVAGVVRQALLESQAVHACPCPRNLADKCEAMALTNSGWFIRPVAAINGRTLRMDKVCYNMLSSGLMGQTGIPLRFACD